MSSSTTLPSASSVIAAVMEKISSTSATTTTTTTDFSGGMDKNNSDEITPIFLQTRACQGISGAFVWLALFLTCQQVSQIFLYNKNFHVEVHNVGIQRKMFFLTIVCSISNTVTIFVPVFGSDPK